MRQRVAIAIALLNDPVLIIADEPTTALDVTIQGQILFEMQKLTRETGAAMIWITHDLSVIAGLADRVCVMYAGRIVEQGIGVRRVVAAAPSVYAGTARFRAVDERTRHASRARFPEWRRRRSPCPRAARSAIAAPTPTEVCRAMPEMSPIGDAAKGQTVRCHHPLKVKQRS